MYKSNSQLSRTLESILLFDNALIAWGVTLHPHPDSDIRPSLANLIYKGVNLKELWNPEFIINMSSLGADKYASEFVVALLGRVMLEVINLNER